MFVGGEKREVFYPIAEKGENICNDELVNIFNEHKNCVFDCLELMQSKKILMGK